MKRWAYFAAGAVVAGTAALALSARTQFLLGGAFVNAGFRMQDHLHAYDFEHADQITAEEVWKEFREQNELAAKVRERFPRTATHPVVAMLVCMDARIDTSELAGDTRRYYYVVRTAGSVMGPAEQEMLELAVLNGVKLVVLTRHTDCAAEKAARVDELRKAFPVLTAAVDERDRRVAEFLARPAVAERIADGRLLVKQLWIDTTTEHLVTTLPDEPTANLPPAAPQPH
ncbi:MAG: carbonic anhydrase [Myxococcota bacterium]